MKRKKTRKILFKVFIVGLVFSFAIILPIAIKGFTNNLNLQTIKFNSEREHFFCPFNDDDDLTDQEAAALQNWKLFGAYLIPAYSVGLILLIIVFNYLFMLIKNQENQKYEFSDSDVVFQAEFHWFRRIKILVGTLILISLLIFVNNMVKSKMNYYTV
jgi:hypothetical protein